MNFIFRQHHLLHSIRRFVGTMFPLSSCSFSHLFSSTIMLSFCLYYTLLSPLACWMRNFTVLWLLTKCLSQGKNLFYLFKIYQHKNFYCIFISFLLYHWILTMFTIIVKFIFIHICVCVYVSVYHVSGEVCGGQRNFQDLPRAHRNLWVEGYGCRKPNSGLGRTACTLNCWVISKVPTITNFYLNTVFNVFQMCDWEVSAPQ